MTVAELSAALANTNVAAFLRVIRQGESNQNDDAYTLVNGGAHFTDPSRHPYQGLRSPPGRASGAYQFLASTWADVAKRIGATDFGPGWQDLGAVDLLRYRGALDDVIAGRFDEACVKCRLEWTSLPGASESNQTLAKAREVYEKWGGKFAPAQTPVSQNLPPVTSPVSPTEQKMPILALLSAFGPLIAQLIPQIATIMQPKGEVAQRNVQLAQVAFETITKATGQPNVQAAVEAMQKSPELTAEVAKAVVQEPMIWSVIEVGEGGIKGASDRALAIQNADRPFWYNPQFWVSAAFFPMMYLIIGAVLFTVSVDPPDGDVLKLPWWAMVGFDPATRSGLVNLIVGMVFGGVVGVWFGTSYTQQRPQPKSAP